MDFCLRHKHKLTQNMFLWKFRMGEETKGVVKLRSKKQDAD